MKAFYIYNILLTFFMLACISCGSNDAKKYYNSSKIEEIDIQQTIGDKLTDTSYSGIIMSIMNY